MIKNINTILDWFKAGKKPTEQQFTDSWQSFWHKEEIIPQATVENLETDLDLKADQADLEAHINDPDAHGGDRGAYVPYTGATDHVDLGADHRLGAGYVGGGYGDGTPVPASLSARNSVIPPAGSTHSVFGIYNSVGDRGLYTYVDENDVMYVNNMGRGNISSNTVFGLDILSSNTTGYENTAMGFSSLANNTEGRSNMAFGSYTLKYNTSGTRNTAIGAQALLSNTTANYNVGVGHQTMRNNQTTEFNVAMGYSVGQYTTGGLGENIFIGGEAARFLVNSTKSIFIGRQSGLNVSTATWESIGNTSIGYQTMAISWNGDLSYNTAFGYQALRNIKAGNYNSFFGAWTGTSSTENQVLGSYNTVIGSQVILTTAEKSASNQVILSDGQGNRVLFKESSGNVKITGNTYPVSNSVYDFGSASLLWKNIWGTAGNFGNLVITNAPLANVTGTIWLTRNTITGVVESTLPGYALATGITTTATVAAPTATADIVTNLS